MSRPRVLIEDWLPVAAIGAESQRERGASSALPPLYFLHVWWARRPLTTSRAAILGSVLPAWSEEWPDELRDRFEDEEDYRRWFVRLCGILGDPVAGRERILWAKRNGIKLDGNPYGHSRAFTVSPDPADLELMRSLLEATWGRRDLRVGDPMAGGGSIPFEARRYGFPTYANELNPVAAMILYATLDYPFRFGASLAEALRKYGGEVARRMEEHLARFYPRKRGESIHAYVWARTVACPTTGKPVPLSPNWWLRQGAKPVAVRLIADPDEESCRFKILEGDAARAANPSEGTVRRGVGRSPWTGDPIPDDYIKAEAQAGRMGQQLYAVVVKTPRGTTFRAPTADDLEAVEAAAAEVARRLSDWEAQGLVPREPYPSDTNDPRPLHYGMPTWGDLFSPRQLLALVTCLEVIRDVGAEAANDDAERAAAIRTYLAFMLDKGVDYNSRLVRWDSTREKVANTFDRHDFSFKWSHAEFDAAHNLLPWTMSQIVDAYEGLVRLAGDAQADLQVHAGNAISLSDLADGSIDLLCVDPPYYDNVMYAELSDFFYVWEKRTLGDLFPDRYQPDLTSKDEEAVANPARFAAVGGRRRKQLADDDYRRKMTACFREMRRVLSDDGVLTVMFTHKRVDAWDTLASALIEGGFVVETSWPVHTESEQSLHQAKKNAAQSTILLVCRKRLVDAEPVWWDDLKGEVRQVARDKAEEFEAAGIRGVDLYLSTFGPVLATISTRWPVLTGAVNETTGEPIALRPETALDLARREVVERRKRGLLLGRAIEFDHVTDWYLMAWDAFKAAEFPADEARKLAIVLDLDLEDELVRRRRVVTKKQQFVAFLTPVERRGSGAVDAELDVFPTLLDAVHTALLVYQEEGDRTCGRFLERTGLLREQRFKECVRAMIYTIPRTRQKGEFTRVEAELLEALRLRWFDDIEPPADEVPAGLEQLELGTDVEPEEAETI